MLFWLQKNKNSAPKKFKNSILRILRKKYRSWHERISLTFQCLPMAFHFEYSASGCVQSRTGPNGTRTECKRNANAKGTRSCRERYFYCRHFDRMVILYYRFGHIILDPQQGFAYGFFKDDCSTTVHLAFLARVIPYISCRNFGPPMDA